MADWHRLQRGHADRAVFGMWMRIDDPLMADTIGVALIDELRLEIPPSNPLMDADARPLYMCLRCDDVVFSLSSNRYARVHLTWDQRQSEEPLPFTDVFDTKEALLSSMITSGCKSPEQATLV